MSDLTVLSDSPSTGVCCTSYFVRFLSLPQRGYVFAGVCLFVGKITPKVMEGILMKPSETVDNGMGSRWFNFGCDPDHHLDPEILKGLLLVWVSNKLSDCLAKNNNL